MVIDEWWAIIWNFVTHISYSGWVSVAALLVSILNFVGLYNARKKSNDMAIFNLRKDALLQARLSEIEWQKVINEMRGFKVDVEVDVDLSPEKREYILSWISNVTESFDISLLDARAVSEHISASQSSMSEKEVKEYLVAFADTHAKIASNREQIGIKNASLLRVAKNPNRAS
ncbi:hypothetical protein [Pseudomonas sp. BIC9C]|uniref:hypothetical protein n=1 Tax=Pseudomonas sp. BIC9C TaxID=3078458 RepID=UPI002AD35EE2|nr:hypothetical protein [Pseudomonas sp. BIC9C]